MLTQIYEEVNFVVSWKLCKFCYQQYHEASGTKHYDFNLFCKRYGGAKLGKISLNLSHSTTYPVKLRVCVFCWKSCAIFIDIGVLHWYPITLLWRHNGRDGVSNHQPYDYLLNRSFRRRSKKMSKLRVTGHCVGNSPVTGEFPAQVVSNLVTRKMFPFDDVIIIYGNVLSRVSCM